MSAAAHPHVTLSDVDDETIISIWKHVYSHLGNEDVFSGMLVCRTFLKELPSLVSSVNEAPPSSTYAASATYKTQNQLEYPSTLYVHSGHRHNNRRGKL